MNKFLTDEQTKVFEKLFQSCTGSDFMTDREFVDSCAQTGTNLLYRFLLNGRMCFAFQSFDAPGYECVFPASHPLSKNVLPGFKRAVEGATENLPYFPLDISHFKRLLKNSDAETEGKVGIVISCTALYGIQKKELKLRIFFDKDEVLKIVEKLETAKASV